MSQEELDAIRAAAEIRGMTVSAWVRLVLREERMRGGSVRGSATVHEPGGRYGDGDPTGAVDVSRRTVELDLREDLLDAVVHRYRLPSRRAAVELALRRVAITPMARDEVLAMEGAGWDGDLDRIRRGSEPGATW